MSDPAPRRRKLLSASLLRSAVSSLAAVAAEFAVMVALVSALHVHYLVAAVLSTAVYLLLHFVLHRRWAFGAGGVPVGRQLLRHLGVAAVGMGQAVSLLWLFVGLVKLPYPVGWAAAGCIGFGTWTYPVHRRYTFRGSIRS